MTTEQPGFASGLAVKRVYTTSPPADIKTKTDDYTALRGVECPTGFRPLPSNLKKFRVSSQCEACALPALVSVFCSSLCAAVTFPRVQIATEGSRMFLLASVLLFSEFVPRNCCGCCLRVRASSTRPTQTYSSTAGTAWARACRCTVSLKRRWVCGKRPCKAVVFNLIHALTQINLTTPYENFQWGMCNTVVF